MNASDEVITSTRLCSGKNTIWLKTRNQGDGLEQCTCCTHPSKLDVHVVVQLEDNGTEDKDTEIKYLKQASIHESCQGQSHVVPSEVEPGKSEPFLSKAAVALTFKEMSTPYASGRENCVRKFGNAYQRKEMEKRMTHSKSTFTTRLIRQFSKIKRSQIMRAFPSQYSSVIVFLYVVRDVLRSIVPVLAYAVRIAAMILRTARFLCVLCAEICVNATPGIVTAATAIKQKSTLSLPSSRSTFSRRNVRVR